MTPESLYHGLIAIRAQVDALIAAIPKADAPTGTPPTSDAPPPSVSPVQCKHPQNKREPITGFGESGKRFRCGVCDFQGEG